MAQASPPQLQRDRIADLLDQMEQEHGPIASEVMDKVREEWPGANYQAQ